MKGVAVFDRHDDRVLRQLRRRGNGEVRIAKRRGNDGSPADACIRLEADGGETEGECDRNRYGQNRPWPTDHSTQTLTQLMKTLDHCARPGRTEGDGNTRENALSERQSGYRPHVRDPFSCPPTATPSTDRTKGSSTASPAPWTTRRRTS